MSGSTSEAFQGFSQAFKLSAEGLDILPRFFFYFLFIHLSNVNKVKAYNTSIP